MKEKAKLFLTCLVLAGILNGCAKTETPAESQPEQTASSAVAEASGAPVIPVDAPPQESPAESEPEEVQDLAESAPVEAEQPQAEPAVIVMPASQAPQIADRGTDGMIKVSDELYRDIVERTLQTAWALQSGEPIFDGIEDLLTQSSDYVLDIEGMPVNLERRGRFFENVKAGVADDILMIVLGTDEDAPVMVETFHYTGEGEDYSVEQIFAEGGQIVRKSESRRVSE